MTNRSFTFALIKSFASALHVALLIDAAYLMVRYPVHVHVRVHCVYVCVRVPLRVCVCVCLYACMCVYACIWV
jgi:hypothetical protein